jgi:hypothetical protein
MDDAAALRERVKTLEMRLAEVEAERDALLRRLQEHEPPRPHATAAPAVQSHKNEGKACNVFAETGRCRFGAGCRFRHDAKREVVKLAPVKAAVKATPKAAARAPPRDPEKLLRERLAWEVPEWAQQRVLWLGWQDKECVLSRLPRDVLCLVLQWACSLPPCHPVMRPMLRLFCQM